MGDFKSLLAIGHSEQDFSSEVYYRLPGCSVRHRHAEVLLLLLTQWPRPHHQISRMGPLCPFLTWKRSRAGFDLAPSFQTTQSRCDGCIAATVPRPAAEQIATDCGDPLRELGLLAWPQRVRVRGDCGGGPSGGGCMNDACLWRRQGDAHHGSSLSQVGFITPIKVTPSASPQTRMAEVGWSPVGFITPRSPVGFVIPIKVTLLA